jgi:predicted secreted Zn-dependent protease
MSMRFIPPVLAACMLTAACAANSRLPRVPHAPPEANLTYRYYDVHGATAGQLMSALLASTPEATPTGTYFAKTNWTVTWHGEWTADSTACRVVRSTTSLESQMALPRWRATGASADLASDWNNFVRNLSLHERGHVVNALAASREVD